MTVAKTARELVKAATKRGAFESNATKFDPAKACCEMPFPVRLTTVFAHGTHRALTPATPVVLVAQDGDQVLSSAAVVVSRGKASLQTAAGMIPLKGGLSVPAAVSLMYSLAPKANVRTLRVTAFSDPSLPLPASLSGVDEKFATAFVKSTGRHWSQLVCDCSPADGGSRACSDWGCKGSGSLCDFLTGKCHS